MKRLISSLELHKHSDQELADLFSRVSARLTQSGRDTPGRRNALASLETISHARAERLFNNDRGIAPTRDF
jgi:hypothetical protein